MQHKTISHIFILNSFSSRTYQEKGNLRRPKSWTSIASTVHLIEKSSDYWPLLPARVNRFYLVLTVYNCTIQTNNFYISVCFTQVIFFKRKLHFMAFKASKKIYQYKILSWLKRKINLFFKKKMTLKNNKKQLFSKFENLINTTKLWILIKLHLLQVQVFYYYTQSLDLMPHLVWIKAKLELEWKWVFLLLVSASSLFKYEVLIKFVESHVGCVKRVMYALYGP